MSNKTEVFFNILFSLAGTTLFGYSARVKHKSELSMIYKKFNIFTLKLTTAKFNY